MQDCIKKNVTFVDNKVAKVEMNNKEFLGSISNFFVFHGADGLSLEG